MLYHICDFVNAHPLVEKTDARVTSSLFLFGPFQTNECEVSDFCL